MSDRLPFRRRSGGGKHVATRTARRRLPVVVQGGVAAALAAGLGFTAVNPALGGPSQQPAVVEPPASATADLAQVRNAARDATREDLAQIADVAVTQAAQVRAEAQSAQLPADRLAALDALQRRVDELVGKVEPRRLSARVSRGGGDRATGGGRGDAAGSGGEAGAGGAGADEGVAGSDATGADEGAAGLDQATGVSDEGTPTTDGAGASDSAGAADGGGASATSSSAADGDPAEGSSGTEGSSGATKAGAETDSLGTLSALDITDTVTLSAVLPLVAEADPTASALRASLLELARTASELADATDAAQAAAQAATEAAAAQAAQEAAAAEQRRAWAASLDGYPNGRIPQSALCAPAFDAHVLLRCDAAQALDQLNAAYAAAFGTNLTVTDSYRSYGAQVTCRRNKGSLCATPGTSNHGRGLAVDFGGAADAFGTDTHDWLLANAQTYGWDLPSWARANGSKPEPWHWEYQPAA